MTTAVDPVGHVVRGRYSAPSTFTLAMPLPRAKFGYAPTSGPAPLTVTFTERSLNGPTSWSWSFGDGATSTLRSPSHTYSAAGTYTASLTVSNAAGSSAPLTAKITVLP